MKKVPLAVSVSVLSLFAGFTFLHFALSNKRPVLVFPGLCCFLYSLRRY